MGSCVAYILIARAQNAPTSVRVFQVQELVLGQVTIIFVVYVGLSVCLFVCCAEIFSAVFDPISIKIGHMLYGWV